MCMINKANWPKQVKKDTNQIRTTLPTRQIIIMLNMPIGKAWSLKYNLINAMTVRALSLQHEDCCFNERNK